MAFFSCLRHYKYVFFCKLFSQVSGQSLIQILEKYKYFFLVTLRACSPQIKLKDKVLHSHFSMILTTNCRKHHFCENLRPFLNSFVCCHSTLGTEKCFPKKKATTTTRWTAILCSAFGLIKGYCKIKTLLVFSNVFHVLVLKIKTKNKVFSWLFFESLFHNKIIRKVKNSTEQLWQKHPI